MSKTLRSIAAYLRISKDDPASTSIEKQRAGIEKWLAENAPTASVEWFVEPGVSGSKDVKRPRRDALESRLDEFDALVVFSPDRLARSTIDLLRIVKAAGEARCAFVPLSHAALDTTTAHGRAFLGIAAVLAQLEAEITGERVRATNAHRRNTGRRALGGPPVFGWVRDGDHWRPDPERAPLVRQAALAIAEGRSSLRGVAADWTRRGIPTARGKAEWSHRAVEKIMRHPILGGFPDVFEGAPIGEHDPEAAILSADEWAALNAGLAKRAVSRTPAGFTERSLLHGRIECASGHPMYRHAIASRGTVRYSCNAVGCKGHSIDVATLDAYVVQEVLEEFGDVPSPLLRDDGDEVHRADVEALRIDAEVRVLTAKIGTATEAEEIAALATQIAELRSRQAGILAEAAPTGLRLDVTGGPTLTVREAFEAADSASAKARALWPLRRVVVLPGKRGGQPKNVSARVKIEWNPDAYTFAEEVAEAQILPDHAEAPVGFL